MLRMGTACSEHGYSKNPKRYASPSIALPVPGGGKKRQLPPSQANVMRLANVIIKLKTGQNLVEFLLANNLGVSLARRAGGSDRENVQSLDQRGGAREAGFPAKGRMAVIAYSVGIPVIFLYF
jgi:hypothetical protein